MGVDIGTGDKDSFTPTIYRASGLGYCDRSIVAEKLGYPKQERPERVVKAMQEGTDAEEGILREYEDKQTQIVTRQQEEVVIRVTPLLWVVGHIDGIALLAHHDSESNTFVDMVLDAKNIAHSTFLTWVIKGWETDGLMEQYKWQLSAYSVALGLPGALVARDKETGELLVLDMPTPFYDLEAIRARVIQLEQYVQDQQLPDCTRADYSCPFRGVLCQGEGTAEDAVIQDLGMEYDRWRAVKVDAESKMKEIAEKLKGMTGAGLYDDGLVRVSWSDVNRTVWDEEGLERDGVELKKYQRKEKVGVKANVKVRK